MENVEMWVVAEAVEVVELLGAVAAARVGKFLF